MTIRRFGVACFLLSVLTGCRSERVAFEFRPQQVAKFGSPIERQLPPDDAPTATKTGKTMKFLRGGNSILSASATQMDSEKAGTSTSLPKYGPARIKPRGLVKLLPTTQSRQWQKYTLLVRKLQTGFAVNKGTGLAQCGPNSSPDKTFGWTMITAGLLLIVGGVILGLLIGGWPGLGVALILSALGGGTSFVGHFFLSYFVRR